MIGVFSYALFFVTIASIFAIATLGLNLQWGQCGQFNAGVVGFVAVGAYTQAILTVGANPEFISGIGLPFPLALVASIAITAVVALLIGLLTIRLRSDYLALATFGIAATIQLLLMNLDPLTGGARGIPSIPRPFSGLPPIQFALAFCAITVGLVLVSVFLLGRLVASPYGRLLRAIRDDEVAAASLGKPVARIRVTAFVIGASFMGLAGALYASFVGYVSPFDFLPIMTFQIWAMLIVGGSGSNKGAVLGAYVVWGLWSLSGVAVVSILPTALQTQGGAIQAILIGTLLILMLIGRPMGLVGTYRKSASMRRRPSNPRKLFGRQTP
ncbi:branched-chain amino acid ABC transporter permease [Acuticoccus kandeliae]|uniref:branched-chain amino acid ABC transporter permease n=1 Tax=Acuticoccus kandeliae TaxID=2073160 RepID=UPI000D3EA213|nr:branched-chain amino acid ABC transporter permease [Acuticoccus kandeliae]